jgi:hypothetical protein
MNGGACLLRASQGNTTYFPRHFFPASLPDQAAKLPMTVQASGMSVNCVFRQSDSPTDENRCGGPPAPPPDMLA